MMLTARRLNELAKKFKASEERECSCPPRIQVIRPGDLAPDAEEWDGLEQPPPCGTCGGKITYTVIKVVPRDSERGV